MSDKIKRIDFTEVQKSPQYTKLYGWKLLPENLAVIQDSLINRGATNEQLVSFLSQVVPESGGSESKHPNGSMGIISRRGKRKVNYPTNLSGQIHVEMEGLFGPFQKDEWHHGGTGSGFNSARDAQKAFQSPSDLWNTTNAVMRGYVRPEPSEYQKRFDFANFLKTFLK